MHWSSYFLVQTWRACFGGAKLPAGVVEQPHRQSETNDQANLLVRVRHSKQTSATATSMANKGRTWNDEMIFRWSAICRGGLVETG